MKMRGHIAVFLLVGTLPGHGWAFLHTPQGFILAARSRAAHASSLGCAAVCIATAYRLDGDA